jgi:acetolactate synthase-1/2/3 large subunit
MPEKVKGAWVKASDLFIHALEEEGVKYVFGIPGEEIMDIMDSLSRSSIHFYLTRHEQGAAFMANTYGRLTGEVGVCLATLGPGATNLTTGVADAFLDHSPLLAITGQTELNNIYKGSHQYIDTVDMFKPITKWNTRINRPEAIPKVIRKAFRIAKTEKPGATHIEIPEDIAAMNTDGEPLDTKKIQYPQPDMENIEKAAKMIKEAKFPIIISGNGVLRRNAGNQLRALAMKLNIPVVHTFMGMGVVESNSHLSLFTVGLQSNDWIMCGLDKADVVITAGYDFVEYAPNAWNSGKKKHIIHIDTLPGDENEYYRPEVEITGELKSALESLAEATETTKENQMGNALREMMLSDLAQYRDDDEFPVKPQKAISDLRRVLKDNDILISDVGAHKLWLARMYPANKPNTVIISNGFAAMGIGIPSGIAAKLVYPERKVVVVSGDGGFLMNAQELETAKRLGTAFVTVVWVDDSLGLIEWKQRNKFGTSFGVNFSNPDFEKFADSLGLPGFRVTKTEDFLPILRKALDLPLPSIVELPVDYRENLKLTEKLGHITCPT